jgi:hypothetical protein
MAVASSNTNIEFCASETQTERNRANQMVGATEADDYSFVWDENSICQLYFHARFSFKNTTCFVSLNLDCLFVISSQTIIQASSLVKPKFFSLLCIPKVYWLTRTDG